MHFGCKMKLMSVYMSIVNSSFLAGCLNVSFIKVYTNHIHLFLNVKLNLDATKAIYFNLMTI